MNSGALWSQNALHQAGELGGGFEGRMLALGDDLTGNRARAFLFAIDAEDPRQFIEAGGAEDVPGRGAKFTVGFPGLAAHAHIERTFPLKTEAPPGLVK